MRIDKEEEGDIDSINQLSLELFGKSFPNLRRAANILRQGKQPDRDFSLVVRSEHSILQASIRCFRIGVEFKNGIKKEALLLGPLMVRPEVRGLGYGVKLVETVVLESAKQHFPLLTIGDPGYFVPRGFNVINRQTLDIDGEVAPLSVMIYGKTIKFCVVRKI